MSLKKYSSIFFIVLLLGIAIVSYGKEDAGHSKDYRTFYANGDIQYGQIKDSYTADLVIYLAGNQFMVIEELITSFQSHYPDIETIYVETIPPGQILKTQILSQGKVNGQLTAQNPDLYASVNLGHLKQLKAAGIMDDYMIYTHNKLELMIAAGNPKNIKDVKDLGREDLIHSHPNPLTEGIFRFYGSQMLKDLGLYELVTGGVRCKGCWAVEGKTWFTERHHRETPQRIEEGLADVGIVWTTEVKYAQSEGRDIEGVEIPAPYNMSHRVAYAIGILNTGRNLENASHYLEFLMTDEAQEIYASYGFIKADSEELILQPIP